MKRFPLVFLSLVILVTCGLMASSNTRVGKAAPDRTIPWWFGNTTFGSYADHACKDGIVVWAMTGWKDENEQYPTVSLWFGDESFDSFGVERNLDRLEEGYWVGQWIINWPQEMIPGDRVGVSINRVHRSPFPDEDEHHFPIVIENCYVPEQPEPESFKHYYSCEDVDSETCESEFKPRVPDFTDPYNLLDTVIYEIPIAKNGPCRVTQLIVEDNELITDLDLGLYMTSAPAALHSISLTSPQGTTVQLIDKEDTADLKASFRYGSYCGTNVPTFTFDDDSHYELADAVRDFYTTSFKPVSGRLSDFNGENPQGIWTMEVCNIDAPIDKQVNIGGNMDFEKGHTRWVESSPQGNPLILKRDDLENYDVLPHGGNWAARLGGTNNEITSISQTINAQVDLEPHDPLLHLWYRQESTGLCGPNYDQLKISTTETGYPVYHEEYSFDLCGSKVTNEWRELTVKFNYLFVDQYYDVPLPNQFDFKIQTINDNSSPSSVFLDDLRFEFGNEGSLLRCWALDISSGQATLNIIVNGQGSVEKTPESPIYGSGKIVSLKATPNSGYTFSGWSGDASGTTNPIQITMNGNKSVTATFTPIEGDTYTLQTQSSSGGSIDRNPNKTVYQSGEVVTLTADPDDGYVFDGWGGDASGTANPIQITMDSNRFVMATFRPINSTYNYLNFAPVVITN